MRILLIGNGSIGKKRYAALAHTNHTVTVADLNEKYNPEDYQAVFICTPTTTHIELAHEFAFRQIPCFIEKPLSNSLRNVQLLEGLFGSVPNMVACNLRFTRLQEIQKEIKDSDKRFSSLSVFRYNLSKWRTPGWKGYSQHKSEGGGIILEAIHELDYLYWMFGEIDEIKAMSACLPVEGVDEDVETSASISIRFSSGAISTAYLDSLSPNYARNFFCTDGNKTWNWELTEKEKETMYGAEILHFLECVSKGTQTINPISQHRRVLQAALSAQSSCNNPGTYILNKIS